MKRSLVVFVAQTPKRIWKQANFLRTYSSWPRCVFTIWTSTTMFLASSCNVSWKFRLILAKMIFEIRFKLSSRKSVLVSVLVMTISRIFYTRVTRWRCNSHLILIWIFLHGWLIYYIGLCHIVFTFRRYTADNTWVPAPLIRFGDFKRVTNYLITVNTDKTSESVCVFNRFSPQMRLCCVVLLYCCFVNILTV